MILRSPPFFLLDDSWLLLAGGAGVVVLAGCVALESGEVPVLAGCVVSVAPEAVPEAAGAASVAGGLGRAFGLPGVIVSTAAVFPTLDVVAALALGCKLNPMVSSPDSLAGVIVGGPLRAAVDTSGDVFRKLMVRFTIPGRVADCYFCIRATASGSGGGIGTPNFVSLLFASPTSGESG